MPLMLNILASLATKELSDELVNIVHGVDGVHLRVRPQRGGLAPSEGEEAPDVLICEVPENDDAALQGLEKALSHPREGVSIYAIGNSGNAELMRRLMRAGVRDMLPSPLIHDEVRGLLARLMAEKRTRLAAAGEITSVTAAFFNAKGSCGATLLAVNAAASLALRGRASVALLDFDLQFGAAALILDLKPQRTIVEALREPDRIDSVFLKALMTEHSSGLHVLASPGELTSVTAIQPAAVRRLIETASTVYDVVIIDMPRLITGWTLEAMRVSDTVYVVTQNSLGAIRDTKLILDFLIRNGFPPNKVEVINNRAMAKSQSVPIDDMKAALKKTRVHRIRNDYEAAMNAEDKGVPLKISAPHSHLSQDIDHLADSLWQVKPGQAPEAKPGFIERLFNHKPATGIDK